MLCYAEVKQIYKYVGNGSTNPILVNINKSDCYFDAVIKVFNNEQGNLALINELVCSEIAKIIGISVPESGVAMLKENQFAVSLKLKKENYGLCFYSTLINKVSIINKNNVSFVKNKNVFEDMLLFDHIIYNKDRNIGNMLITQNDNIAYLIDHSHAFKNETIWNKSCFKQGMYENDYLDETILENNMSVYRNFYSENSENHIDYLYMKDIIEKYKKLISKEKLLDIINDVPVEWMETCVSKDDLDALVEYILFRIDNIDLIFDVIIKYKGW